MAKRPEHQTALHNARQYRESNGAKAIVYFLEEELKDWLEALVDAEGAERDRLQGAIRRVRRTLKTIQTDAPTPSEQPDGGYTV